MGQQVEQDGLHRQVDHAVQRTVQAVRRRRRRLRRGRRVFAVAELAGHAQALEHA